jgi:hypothetical protein
LWQAAVFRGSVFHCLSFRSFTIGGIAVKTIAKWDQLSDFGIDPLTGEACSLGYRILCDLTEQGKRIVERCLSVEIQSENWNAGSEASPHVASILLTQEMIVPLGVFALLDTGCREVWVTARAAIGIEPTDTQSDVERMRQVWKPQRCFAYRGPFQDRNQHQMSGRVR